MRIFKLDKLKLIYLCENDVRETESQSGRGKPETSEERQNVEIVLLSDIDDLSKWFQNNGSKAVKDKIVIENVRKKSRRSYQRDPLFVLSKKKKQHLAIK